MTFRRAFLWLGIAAALAIGIGLRLSTRTELQAGSGVRGLTPDDYYHLRRARFAAAQYPRTIVLDPLMDFPQGGVAIWPPLFDVALATPSWLLHGKAASPASVERGAAWVPVAFAAGAIVLACLLGRRLWGDAAGVALALFVALCPGHVHWTQYGHTDQHVLESFAGLLVLWLYLRSRELRTPASEAWTGAALAFAVLSWQGAIYWGAIFALALFLESLRTRQSVLRATLAILGLASLLSLAGTLAWLGRIRTPFTYVSFGLFQPFFLGALCGGTILVETVTRALAGGLPRRELARRVGLLAAVALAILPFSADLALGLVRGVGYVLGKTSEVSGTGGYVSYPQDWLKGIFETRPLLTDGPALALHQLSAAFFLAPLAIALWVLRAVRGIRPGVSIGLAIWGSVTLFLALTQRLNVYYAAPLAGAALIETVRLIFASLGGSRLRRAAAAGAAAVLLVVPMIFGLRQEIGSVAPPGSDLFSTLDWMKAQLPHSIDPYDPRLLSPPPGWPADRAGAVLAPWSLGHLILYEAELPVVANNFGYGFLDSVRFFLAEFETEALRIARRRGVRWVVATDLTPRMNDYAGYLGRPPYFAPTKEGGLIPSAQYFRTLQSRLYDLDGAGGQALGLPIEPLRHFRLIHHSASAIRRGPRWLARWKVFEVVD